MSSANITPLGKHIRKHRIDTMQSLRDMASTLGVSPAYLSSIETGKKDTTESIISGIANELGEAIGDIRKLAFKSNSTMKLDITFATEAERDLLAEFTNQLLYGTPTVVGTAILRQERETPNVIS